MPKLHRGLVAASFTFLFLPGSAWAGDTYSRIVLGGFSPDGKQIALSYCLSVTNCKTGMFDLARKRFTVITPPDKDSFYIPGGISPDGKWLAVTVRNESDKGRVTQLALIDLATGKPTELTHAPGRRAGPSFSHDGKKIIYAKASRERSSGMTRFVDWDIYQIGVAERTETRLTAFNFFSVTPPSYVGNDQEFIFSGDVTNAYVAPSGAKGREAYAALYKDNHIFQFTVGGHRALSPIFLSGRYSSAPIVSSDGFIVVYTGMSNELDGIKTRFTYDLFQYDGIDHKRLTKLGDPFLMDTVMSPNGRSIAFVLESRDQRRVNELKLLDVTSGKIESLSPVSGPGE